VAEFNVHHFDYYGKKGYERTGEVEPWTSEFLFAPSSFIVLEKRLL